ncbi:MULTISPECIES: hypothetical protein [Raoultella]|nr:MULTISPECIES: hypothetical protein [Raoultella]EJD6652165.1 hypothetical protein [Raoultella ornithinolytica]EKW7682954.1 hypothetical protein [Raoultella ornithinolytica]ELN4413618.1 hypothetical protein [Raoultella ornithinolytica]ELT0849485.1 hypothetical protein [Raoultella ornithinolytica]ELV3659502.1 hypothetical protein [Raoultella ornithinolytica]
MHNLSCLNGPGIRQDDSFCRLLEGHFSSGNIRRRDGGCLQICCKE